MVKRQRQPKRMGRPPFPAGTVKDTLVVFRVDPGFHKALIDAAKRQDKPLGVYIRDVLARHLEESK